MKPLAQFNSEKFLNRKTGRPYTLVRGDSVAVDKNNVEKVRAICNEPAVYGILFQPVFKGSPYSAEKAESFLNWAAKGWAERSHFVFLVLDASLEICGTVDIKSPELEGAEIGYWASEKHSGIITPAVGLLCEVARGAGYKSLYAFVLPANTCSLRVLSNNAFQVEERGVTHKDKICDLYRKVL